MNPRFMCTVFIFLGLSLGGCSTNTVNTSTVVCEPGEQICDDAAVRVLECHPNGAAWVILAHCAETQFCKDARCLGEIPNSAPTDIADSTDAEADGGVQDENAQNPDTQGVGTEDASTDDASAEDASTEDASTESADTKETDV